MLTKSINIWKMKTNRRLGFQTSLAIGLGIFITYFLQIEKPYWTLLTIILLICPRYEQTLYKSFLRIVSTILGTTLCGVTLWILDTPQTYYLLAGLGAYFTVYYGKISYFKTIFSASVMVIATLGIVDPWSWTAVASRIYQTALGAFVATFITIIISPVKNKSEYFSTVKEILKQEILFYKEGSSIFFAYDRYWEILKKNRKNLNSLRKNELEIFFKKIITFRSWKNFHLSKILHRNLILIGDIFFVLNNIRHKGHDFRPYLNLFRYLVNQEFEAINKIFELEIEFAPPSKLENFSPQDIDYLCIVSFSEKLNSNLRLTKEMIRKNEADA